jgi:hypothetical protein
MATRPSSATAGYSGTPLAKKLGIKPGSRVHVAGAPKGYRTWLAPIPDDVSFQSRVSEETTLAHAFFTRRADLRRALAVFRTQLPTDAALWISWPKKSSGVATDITEDVIREDALPLGWVDVKVCAVTDVWSGLKLVVRRELR